MNNNKNTGKYDTDRKHDTGRKFDANRDPLSGESGSQAVGTGMVRCAHVAPTLPGGS